MAAFHHIDLGGDHHVHTRFCNHADGEMEEYVQAAIQNGLHSMTFLEHLECGIRYEQRIWLTPELFTLYFKEGQRLQKKYAAQITISLGVEIGCNPEAIDELLAELSRFPFEHKGLSCHFYFDNSRHLNMLSRRQEHINALTAVGQEKILDAYFSNLILGCKELPCDKLCHLDAALRYLPKFTLTAYHKELIAQLLMLMQQKNIALEINTSGYAVRPHPYPAPSIIDQAIELGIPLIVGSDAHHPEQVGRYFDRLS
ncbi:MAG: histidinol-phosphatase HisJ family protein [Candidatus Electrothrix sp. AR3]|nr:histidinol-phosphatase HisJ family protein [Candidatus Electrothrix sp. AR3]